MALPGTNQSISLSQVNTELGKSSTATISLNDAAVRALFGKATGAISFADGWGKINPWTGAITSNQTVVNLRTWATSAGWNGTVPAIITLNANCYIYSGNTASNALTIDGSWPNGVTFVNNGFVLGMGGAGGAGGTGSTYPYYTTAPAAFNGSAGTNGGNAISLGVNCTIANNGTIAGGGGGGGGGAITQYLPMWGTFIMDDDFIVAEFSGGGMGGGGKTGLTNSTGGNAGTSTNPGAGVTNGGGGGAWGTTGVAGTAPALPANKTLTSKGTPGAGGAAGKCVALNGFTVTWAATGTRDGAIS
ncbi:MAG: hypothetical protein RJB66_1475 [Pseudomonadota bacterium]|jgi:hypothetical protein